MDAVVEEVRKESYPIKSIVDEEKLLKIFRRVKAGGYKQYKWKEVKIIRNTGPVFIGRSHVTMLSLNFPFGC